MNAKLCKWIRRAMLTDPSPMDWRHVAYEHVRHPATAKHETRRLTNEGRGLYQAYKWLVRRHGSVVLPASLKRR